MGAAVILATLSAWAGSAQATQATAAAAHLAATPRETFLAAAIAAMAGCGLLSFFLAGRVGERTHVALALLVVLIGAFALFTLYGPFGRQYPMAGALVLIALIGLFKLMNQFEIRRKPGGAGRAPSPPRQADRP